MIYVIIAIIIIVVCRCVIEELGKRSARRYLMNNPADSFSNETVNSDIPVPLRGIHPSSDNFWGTVDFFVRVGNACYSITHNNYSLVIDVYKSGEFNTNFFDIDSARTLLPGLDSSDMVSNMRGRDKNGEAMYITLSNVKNTLENDAPEAEIKVFEAENQKSISIMWKTIYY